jgi:hypothetical protein
MIERRLTPNDAALRRRIKELSVHVPCGRLRGPLPRVHPESPIHSLGRHSIMNGISVQGGQSPEVTAAQIERLARFARDQRQLDDWQAAEFRRLASGFDPQADVALSEWQRRWPPGREAARDAMSRIVGLPAEEV